MLRIIKQNGFSLTEVLIATAILAMGLMMIAMAFPVGVKLTSVATERTVGTVAANEAFAIFQLYSQDPDGAGLVFTGIDCMKVHDNNSVSLPEIVASMPNTSFLKKLNNDDLLNYPSIPGETGKYHWSLLARRTDVTELQLTVFVSRRMDTGATYYFVDYVNNTSGDTSVWPQPIRFNCSFAIADPQRAKELKINVTPNFTIQDVDKFIIEGATIVDDRLGTIYRVVERKDIDLDGFREILLDKDWQEDLTATISERGNPKIWLIPPAVGSSRNPCIFVQQRIVRF